MSGKCSTRCFETWRATGSPLLDHVSYGENGARHKKSTKQVLTELEFGAHVLIQTTLVEYC